MKTRMSIKRTSISMLLIVALIVTMAVPALATTQNAHELSSDEERWREAQIEIEELAKELKLEERGARISDETIVFELSEFEIINELAIILKSSYEGIELSDEAYEMVATYKILFGEQMELFKTFDDENLRNLGYTDYEIYLIRSFDGSYYKISALSAIASVWLTPDFVRYRTSIGITEARLVLEFRWDRVPVFGMSDYMTIVWNDWSRIGQTANVMYVDTLNTLPTRWQAPTIVASGVSNPAWLGVSYRLPARIDNNRFAVREGFVIVTLEDTVRNKTLRAHGEMTHRTAGLVVNPPSFGLNGFNAPSITIGFTAQRWPSNHVDRAPVRVN